VRTLVASWTNPKSSFIFDNTLAFIKTNTNPPEKKENIPLYEYLAHIICKVNSSEDES
jgi:hypothetical protein